MPVTFSWSTGGEAPIVGESAAAATPGSEFGATALRDKALDPVTGDLLQVDGDQVYVVGVDAIASDLVARLSVWLGECFIDTSRGVDYQGKVLTRFSDEGEIRQEFRTKILQCPGIVDVVTLTVEKDRELRLLSISFSARADTGDVIDRTLEIDFSGED